MSYVRTRTEGPLRVVTLDRPERMNAIGGALLDDLHEALQEANDDASCRVIVLTEQRGLIQVEELLRNPAVLGDPVMLRIFRTVHKDEPDHFLPYRDWLTRQGRPIERWNEKVADWCIHKILLLKKMPTLFFDAGAARMEQWPDAGEAAS